MEPEKKMILSELPQTQKYKHVDISYKAKDTHASIHRSREAREQRGLKGEHEDLSGKEKQKRSLRWTESKWGWEQEESGWRIVRESTKMMIGKWDILGGSRNLEQWKLSRIYKGNPT